MMIEKWAKRLSVRKVFLFDAFGALISASLLIWFLIPFQEWIGMPIGNLQILASIAFILFGYSALCFLLKPKKPGAFLSAIAAANLIYASVTIILSIANVEVLTFLGWVYFLVEAFILITLARVEFKKASLK